MSFVALLRAVNVGGIKLPMADLRTLLEGLGLANVRTYLQSGNAVFDAAEPEPAQALATAIEVRIERDVGPRVGVLVLPGESMDDVVAASPFARWPEDGPSGATVADGPDERILHVTFLFGSSDGEADFGEASQAAYSAVYEAAFKRLDLPADRGRGGGVRRHPTACRPRRLPQAAAWVRPHQAEQRLVRADARYGRHHAQLADGTGARGHGRSARG